MALAVVKNKPIPPAKDDKSPAAVAHRKKFETGNRTGRSVLQNAVVAASAVSLFDDNVDTIEASEMWRLITGRFNRTNGD